MFNKKIDIIMPNYNKERFLSEAIESVIRQTYKNWKLYIIDDFSSDNSRKILKGYKKNKKIKVYLLNKNKGPAFCRNLGLKKSNARYIAFLDSDDFWKKNKLKNQINFMFKKNIHLRLQTIFQSFKEKNLKKILKRQIL